ncbi:membrane protein [Streptomyces mashuensis]|uniref:Membrane protein n=1 Tax=Streptomyces mashuensis TaxID=33904 RepID=A0A919AYP4_9ACTN|nr:DMT family transporter [Streptomyces mashuensis]GHF31686.1 membrane protein [Streptomyces mashuensis]
MSGTAAAESGKTNPYLLLTTTMVLWGSGFSSSKGVVEHLPHEVAAVLRFGGGALCLLVALPFFGRGGKTTTRDASRAAAAGLLGVFAYNVFFFWGLSLAPSMDGSTIIPVMSPVLTTSFLLLTRKEKASSARLAGLGLGIAGAVIFFIGAGGDTSSGHDRLLGDFLFLLAAVSWAAYTLTGPKVLAGIEPLKATTYATLAGSVLLALYAAPQATDVHWSGLPGSVWLNVVYVAIGPTAVAYLFYYRGIGAVGPSSASIMMFVVPVFGTLCSTLFLGESFGVVQTVGAVVLLSGAVLAVTQGKLPGRRSTRTAQATEPAPEPRTSGSAG